jgi:hypothetical protein
VHPSILNITASVEVTETVRLLLGKQPHYANKLFHCDLSEMSFEELDIAKADDCPVCGSRPAQAPLQVKHEEVSEVCGRKGKKVFVITSEKELQVDVDRLYAIVAGEGFSVKARGKLGITFEDGGGVTASVLQSGIVIVEGVNSGEEAQRFSRLLLDSQKAKAAAGVTTKSL